MNTLAVIGGSYLQLPLVLKAKEMGLKTISFSWKKGAVCKDFVDRFYPISVLDKENIADICIKSNIDGVSTIASDVSVPTVSYIANLLGLIANTEHSAYLSTNKYKMRKALISVGVNCPKCMLARSLDDIEDILKVIPFPVIVKPCDRSGSLGVSKATTIREINHALSEALNYSLSGEAVIEEFIEVEREISIEAISWEKKHFILATTDKVTTGPPQFVEIGHQQPSDLSEALINEAVRQLKLALHALQIDYGASHTEFMISSCGKVFITEVGARMGGDFIGSDLVYLSTGYDYLRGVIEVALGCFTQPLFPCSRHSGVWFYSPDSHFVKEYIDRKDEHPEIVKYHMSDLALHELKKSSDRNGYLIYSSGKRLNFMSG